MGVISNHAVVISMVVELLRLWYFNYYGYVYVIMVIKLPFLFPVRTRESDSEMSAAPLQLRAGSATLAHNSQSSRGL